MAVRGNSTRIFQKFDTREDAQARIDELQESGATITFGEWHPFMRKWVIGYK